MSPWRWAVRGISYGIGGLLRGYPMGGFCNAGHGVVAADAER
jgi:F0F1-type ATP synthase membrane subunit c/vacuolar-type H+-ATPase subunit K